LILFEHKCLFIHIPKTGGNSIQNILNTFSEDDIVTFEHHQDGIERFEVRNKEYNITKHSAYTDYQQQLKLSDFSLLFKFAVIRNPWDRLISYYFSPHRNVSIWSREEFIELVHNVKPIRHYICPKNCKDKLDSHIDFLARFEFLEDDLVNISQIINIDFKNLPHRNKLIRRDYRSYYDDQLRKLVFNKFKEEIEFGDYQF
jgi:hypothetical protein